MRKYTQRFKTCEIKQNSEHLTLPQTSVLLKLPDFTCGNTTGKKTTQSWNISFYSTFYLKDVFKTFISLSVSVAFQTLQRKMTFSAYWVFNLTPRQDPDPVQYLLQLLYSPTNSVWSAPVRQMIWSYRCQTPGLHRQRALYSPLYSNRAQSPQTLTAAHYWSNKWTIVPQVITILKTRYFPTL